MGLAGLEQWCWPAPGSALEQDALTVEIFALLATEARELGEQQRKKHHGPGAPHPRH